MKKQLGLLICFIALFLNSAFGQNFEDALKSTFTEFESDSTFIDKLSSGNRFELIAQKWNDQWIAHYYAAYSEVILSYIEKDEAKRDLYLDKADKQFEQLKALLKTDNDEVYVLAAMIANARLAVKPMARYKKYGDIFNENIEKAKSFRPDNPRIYLYQGMSIYHTPKMFGGGPKAALPYFEKAEGLYKNENDGDIMKPYWGKRLNAEMLNTCKKEVGNN